MASHARSRVGSHGYGDDFCHTVQLARGHDQNERVHLKNRRPAHHGPNVDQSAAQHVPVEPAEAPRRSPARQVHRHSSAGAVYAPIPSPALKARARVETDAQRPAAEVTYPPRETAPRLNGTRMKVRDGYCCEFEAEWDSLTAHARSTWSEITDEDIRDAEGTASKLCSIIALRVGEPRETVRDKLKLDSP